MASAQPGWYPDPSGDETKLRYWDGTRWTDNYTANPQASAQQAQPAPQAQPVQQEQPAQQGQPAPQVHTMPQGQHSMTQAQPVYSPAASGSDAVYPVSDRDRTLRLVAFIFMCVSLASTCWLIIPLAWMIPMTIHSWGIYKGKKANSVAFGVCTLIFASLVAGILLLVSEKEK